MKKIMIKVFRKMIVERLEELHNKKGYCFIINDGKITGYVKRPVIKLH